MFMVAALDQDNLHGAQVRQDTCDSEKVNS
jgi:hypothetical protein